MRFTKPNPVGIDSVIDKIQNRLFEKLTLKWGIEIDAYPRVYIVERKGERTIEHYKFKNDSNAKGAEYGGNLITAEKNKFYFLAENDQVQSDPVHASTTISLIFSLKLTDIYPNSIHRCDSEVITDVFSELIKIAEIDPKMSIVTDFKKIFQGFKNDVRDNMQPYLFFKIDCQINNYRINGRLC